MIVLNLKHKFKLNKWGRYRLTFLSVKNIIKTMIEIYFLKLKGFL